MRGNAARLLWPALVVLALVGVVAIAAAGSTGDGSGGIRSPAAVLADTVLSLIAVVLLAAAALLIYGFMRKAAAPEYGSSKPSRGVLAGILVLIAVLISLVYLPPPTLPPREVIEGSVLLEDPSAVPPLPKGGSYEPSFAWLPVTIVLALAAAGVTAFILAERRRRGPASAGEGLAEQLAAALDDTLDDLRAESDPRRAVIAAYARLERVLAALGVARQPAETPEEYLARILGELAVDAEAVRRLTDLFSRAKFSQHAVDIGMKEEAIDAFAQLRDELRPSAKHPEQAGREELMPTEASS